MRLHSSLLLNALLLDALLLTGGCAYQQSRIATEAQSVLIGTSSDQLDMCAGLPTKTARLDDGSELRSYEYAANTNNGVNVTLPVIGGGVSLGSGGYCHAQFSLRDGRVAAIQYAGDTSLAGAPEAVCAPIVQHCVEQRTMAKAGS